MEKVVVVADEACGGGQSTDMDTGTISQQNAIRSGRIVVARG